MKAINPATNTILGDYPAMDAPALAHALERASETFARWRRVNLSERRLALRALALQLRAQRDALARLASEEMGKPIRQARVEVEKCAWVCEYYAEEGWRALMSEHVRTDSPHSYVAFLPLGPVLGVMPWNFPFWQVFRFAAPTILAGNTVVLKHAANVPGCALAIQRVFEDAGVEGGILQTVLVERERIASIIEDPRIAAITLTGSTQAGRAVARTAGNALKKVVLELGGSDPYIVLEDADLEHAADCCAASRLVNSGQSCIAAKRFIVVRSQRTAFESLLIERMARACVGVPLDETTEVGPLARTDLRDTLHDQVERSVQMGAKLRLGGEIPSRAGAWYPPTVLSQVNPGMPVFDDETFGPVAAVVEAKDEDHALEIANGSLFGLGAAIFTRDVTRGLRLAEQVLEAGCCAVNDYVRSDPRLPFGGVKHSGYGRELGSFGVREFVNVKSIYGK